MRRVTPGREGLMHRVFLFLAMVSAAEVVFGECLLSDDEVLTRANSLRSAYSHEATRAILQSLEDEARCRGVSLLGLIDEVFPPFCQDSDHVCEPVSPSAIGAPEALYLTMDDLPFFPNRRSPEAPNAACEGLNKYSLFMKRNFVFDPMAIPPISDAQAEALFSYEVLADRSGGSLRDFGFFQLEDGRFRVNGASNLRELTSRFPQFLSRLEETYLDWYRPPDGNLWNRYLEGPVKKAVLSVENRRFEKLADGVRRGVVPLPETTTAVDTGSDSNFSSLVITTLTMSWISSVLRHAGTAEIYLAVEGFGWHSLLVRESKDPSQLLVLDSSFPFEHEFTHITTGEGGSLVLDGIPVGQGRSRATYGKRPRPKVKIFWVRPPEPNVFYER